MYVLSQIWVFMALAAMLGFVIGWWFGRCRCNSDALIAERDAARARVTELEQALAASRITPLKAPAAPAPVLATPKVETPPTPAPIPSAIVTPKVEPPPPVAPAPLAAAAPVVAAVISNASFTPSALASMDLDALEAAVEAAGDGVKPIGLLGPMAGQPADDLKEIAGVGPTNEAWLHENGLYHFWQIATMEAPHLAWLANNLPNFGKRVYRENWVEQAMQLARGELTDAKKKYLEGKHS